MTGKVTHFEIPAKNLRRAKSFYKDVFGWTVIDMKGTEYSLVGGTPVKNHKLTESGSINGGMMKREKPFDGPVVTIQVDNIDSSLKAIKRHGGKNVSIHGMKKQKVNGGTSAYFEDSEGNLMGLWQSTHG